MSSVAITVGSAIVVGWLTDQFMERAQVPPVFRPHVNRGMAAAVGLLVARKIR
jgi:hypothetical protein